MEADQARYWRVEAGERWSFSRVLVATGREGGLVRGAERDGVGGHADDFLELRPGDGLPVFVFDCEDFLVCVVEGKGGVLGVYLGECLVV